MSDKEVLRVEDYSLLMRIISTFLCFLGTGSNLIVVYLSIRQFKKDTKAFVTLMQIHAFSNALNSFSGWIVTNRHKFVGDIVLFISYGPGVILGRRFCAIVDCIPTQLAQTMPIMVSMMMVFRCLILFNFKLKRATMIISSIVLYLITVPLFYATATGYVEWENVVTKLVNETDLLREVNNTQAYGMVFTPLNMIIWPYYNKVSIPSLVVCFLVRIIMQVKMRRFSKEMSTRTKSIHSGYMNLLTIDAFVVLLFFIATSIDAVGEISKVSPKLDLLLNLYNYTIFNFPSVMQGCSLLYFVPYLNAPFKRIFTNEPSSTTGMIVVSLGQQNLTSHAGRRNNQISVA